MSAGSAPEEVRRHRNEQLKLIEDQLPELGQCKFAEYFGAALGPTLYQKFMANYTWKMWNSSPPLSFATVWLIGSLSPPGQNQMCGPNSYGWPL